MEVRMRSLFAMILAMMVSFPAISSAQQDQGTLRRVHVMTGAGTLPRNPTNRLEYLRYATTGEPRLTGAQLIERIPEVQKFARVSVESDEFIPYDQPQELKALSLRMTGRLADPDIAGIIFTHGTNTIEETAYFMNLTVRSDKPVVIVGAQRPFSTLSSDGPLNLLNAIRVAADPVSRGKGTLVVLNDEINAARDVTKTNTFMEMALASAGLQIGASDTRYLFIFKDKASMQQFIDSGWDASAGAAASAGTGSKSAGGSTGAFTGGKMYQLTKTGLQVGVAAAGTKVWKDKDLN